LEKVARCQQTIAFDARHREKKLKAESPRFAFFEGSKVKKEKVYGVW